MAVVVPLSPERLARAKLAYTVGPVRPEFLASIVGSKKPPRAGDVVLARVESIGHHRSVELPTGRKSLLYPGDEVVVCYGNRYAPDQFEAVVPDDLGPCDLVAAGGLAARMVSAHASTGSPTRLRPIGLLGGADGNPANLRQWGLPAAPSVDIAAHPTILAVVGTAMNSGKTTSAAHLVRGLVQAGRRVGAAKVTGTGAGPDFFHLCDAGAHAVHDFTHAGHPSTYRLGPAAVEEIFTTLVDHLALAGVDVVVLEVADGLLQPETASLVHSSLFARRVDGVLFAAVDAMGAQSGVQWLRRAGLPVLGVTGVLTSSPLACEEAAMVTGVPVLVPAALRDPAQALQLIAPEPLAALG
jgi:hypothetical protein